MTIINNNSPLAPLILAASKPSVNPSDIEEFETDDLEETDPDEAGENTEIGSDVLGSITSQEGEGEEPESADNFEDSEQLLAAANVEDVNAMNAALDNTQATENSQAVDEINNDTEQLVEEGENAEQTIRQRVRAVRQERHDIDVERNELRERIENADMYGNSQVDAEDIEALQELDAEAAELSESEAKLEIQADTIEKVTETSEDILESGGVNSVEDLAVIEAAGDILEDTVEDASETTQDIGESLDDVADIIQHSGSDLLEADASAQALAVDLRVTAREFRTVATQLARQAVVINEIATGININSNLVLNFIRKESSRNEEQVKAERAEAREKMYEELEELIASRKLQIILNIRRKKLAQSEMFRQALHEKDYKTIENIVERVNIETLNLFKDLKNIERALLDRSKHKLHQLDKNTDFLFYQSQTPYMPTDNGGVAHNVQAVQPSNAV